MGNADNTDTYEFSSEVPAQLKRVSQESTRPTSSELTPIRRKTQKQTWCPATRLLEFNIIIFMFIFLTTSNFSMQCTNISCHSKCKAYSANYTTSFSTSSVCQSLSFLSFYMPLQIMTFFLSCILHSHSFVLFSASYLHSSACSSHKNSPTCNPPKHPELPYRLSLTCIHLLSKITPPDFFFLFT